jgi:hypothetical protein
MFISPPRVAAAKPKAKAPAKGGGSGSTKPTAAQKKAANQLRGIAGFNATSTTDQLNRALGDFDLADRQNTALADVQHQANSKQSAADRFSQLKKLQSSTRGVLGAAGNAMQGSQTGSLIGMLTNRNDADTAEVLGTLAQNQNAVSNSLTESMNANVLSRRDAINNAIFGLRGIEADTAAQMSTINPDLYKAPGAGGTAALIAKHGATAENRAKASGYFLPDNEGAKAAKLAKPGSTMRGTSYFDKLLNSYNQRSA